MSMTVSLKCQYALRATFELAKRWQEGPAKTNIVAEIQTIPVRFLEVILRELRQGGFVESRRGKEGGYSLKRAPDDITVGEIIRFIQGPIGPVDWADEVWEQGPLEKRCVFLPLWRQVREAVSEIYDSTTFGDLLEREREYLAGYVPEYSI